MHKMASMASVQQGWSWKEEPVSPPPFSDLDTDNWFTATNSDYLLAATSNSSDTNSIIIPDQIEVDSKPLTRAETATRLLNDLDEWIKEEPFSDWYEEKIDLPIFEEIVDVVPLPAARKDDISVYESKEFIDICSYDNLHPINGKVHIPTSNMSVMADQTPRPQQIPIQPPTAPAIVPLQIGEQTSVLMQEFDLVLNNHETLTPPESPREDTINLTMLQDMRTEELDELVRIRVESLVEGQDNSSCSSSCHEESSAGSPISSDSGYDDPDWTPAPVVLELKQSKRRRLNKPYSRPPPEEKRQRKKEQNKNAATRYRMKKKAEIEEILGEERELQEKNEKLKTDVSELAKEIKYLKNFMRDVFKAKGLIK